MKQRHPMKGLLLTSLGFVACAHLATFADEPDIPAGFASLLDGQSLAGWHGNNPHQTSRPPVDEQQAAIEKQQDEFHAHWRVEDGELVNDGQGPYATTDKSYGDIQLLIDYKTVPEADSGIYLRGSPQIQIWDTTQAGGKWDRNADKGSGGLFNNTKGTPGQLPLALADKPFGQWNHFDIVQIGSRTWVHLNNRLVVDGAIMENYWDKERKTPLPATGPIHLQTHGGEIRWRNIAVREIDGDEAIRRLRGDDLAQGFSPLFNGTDLSGWTGAVEDYEVRDGAIVCKPGKGGVLFTTEEYDDFVVRVEFKVPPGGNNGLAIRYPGSGRAAYDGMCELQILDDDAEKYRSLDPRQYHGSVYGMAAAHRGYLRPAGQWNYQEVSVVGSTIRVELNGTVIVDSDLSKITEFKDNAPHPGKNLRKGHFGFAGHNDPVMFRNVAIKKLSSSQQDSASQREADIAEKLVFHASFDNGTDANLAAGDGRIRTAESTARKKVQTGNLTESVTIAQGEGKFGDALRFRTKSKQVLFYQGKEFGYRDKNWSGSVSFWMKLDPNRDLEPGFCDPIQITQRGWNNGAFFIDFDKDLPRDLRLGVFPDYTAWNPDDIPWDDVPPADRPLVTVKNPPFASDRWTHVCFTFERVNAEDGSPATSTLYLNGRQQGSIRRPVQLTWDPDQVAIMLGINYIGLMDDLLLFEAALTTEEVELLYQLPGGGSRLAAADN